MSSIKNYRELWQQLRQHNYKPVYLLYGAEEGLVLQAESIVRGQLLQEQDEMLQTMNFLSLSGTALELAELVEAVSASPMFATRRVVSVIDFAFPGKGRGKEPETEQAFFDIIEGCPQSTVLIITAPGIAKSNRVYQLIEERGAVYEFPPLARADAQDIISAEARKYGIEFDRQATAELMAMVGVDGKTAVFRSLKSEVAKLAAYAGYSGNVSSVEVQLLVARSAEAKIWDLTDAVSAGDFAAAIGRLQELWQDGYEPLRVLASLSAHVSSLLLSRRSLDGGISAEDVVKALGKEPYRMHSFPATKIVNVARRMSADTLSVALSACLELDLGIKTGKRNPLVGVEMLTRSLCQL